jgi:ribonuclease BN (tRNA processing enzyme)
MADDAFRILPLGVGEAFTARHYTTCLALGAGGAWMLVDCPHPVRKMLREAADAAGLGLDLDGVLGAAVTHLHADHCSGLEDFGYYSHFVLGRRARLLAHPEVSARLWDGVLSGGMGEWQVEPGRPPVRNRLDSFFELTALGGSAPATLGPFSVECRKTVHSVPATALKVTAGGRVLGFSSDTAFDPTLIDWLAPCDLIVHEATGLEESDVHTPYRFLAALPAPLRAKMRLIHYPDDFDAAASAIEPLRQGRLYPV